MTQKHQLVNLLLVALTSATCFTSCSETKTWPQFRGSSNNMVFTGENIPDSWSTTENIKWTYDFEGEGWSSPIIIGDKVFITSAFSETKKPVEESVQFGFSDEGSQEGGMPQEGSSAPAGSFEDRDMPGATPDGNMQSGSPGGEMPGGQFGAEEDEAEEPVTDIYKYELICLDLETGEELWTQIPYEGYPKSQTHSQNTYASETPVSDGKYIYAYYGMMGVYCYDLNGNLQWQSDIGTYKTLNSWGTGSSPALYDGVLYIQVDNEESSFVVALDTKTGEQIWKQERDEETNYSTPIVWENTERNELVTMGKNAARSYDLKTGELLWQLNVDGADNISSSVADENLIYIGNNDDTRTAGSIYAVKAGASGDITPADGETTSSGVQWSVTKSGLGAPSPILYDGILQLVTENGGKVYCYDAQTGELIYNEKVKGVSTCWASPWKCNDKVYFTDQNGSTFVIKAGKEFELLGENIIDETIWASIASTGESFIMRGQDKLYCIAN